MIHKLAEGAVFDGTPPRKPSLAGNRWKNDRRRLNRRATAPLYSAVAVAYYWRLRFLKPWRTEGTPRTSAVLAPPNDSPPPGRDSFDRLYAPARGGASLPPGQRDGNGPVSAFVVDFAPGTTRMRQRRGDCLAAPPPGSRRLLFAPRSRSSAFEPPGDHAGHRGTTPAAEHLPRLVSNVHPPFTSLGVTPGPGGVQRVPAPAPFAAVPWRDGRFRGTEYRSVPLPLHPTSSQFGLASPADLTGKPLRAFRG